MYQRLLLLYYYNKHTLSTKRVFSFAIIIITSFDNKIVEPNALDGDQTTASKTVISPTFR